MMDTTLDGRPVIRCAWPESCFGADNGPVRTLEETAAYMREHGIPRATTGKILDIERTALRKLRHHPEILRLHEEIAS